MIVNTSEKYNSILLKSDIIALSEKYPFLQTSIIGYSVLKSPIYCIKVGHGSNKILYCAATHGNEWITSTLLMKFLENLCISYTNNSSLYGYNIKELLSKVTFYIVPMVNPDGVDLVNNLIVDSNAKYIASNYQEIPFPSGWKANINGVGFTNFHHF